MWTGNDTFSRTLQASDLQDIDATLQRQVLLWDNYPLTVAPLGGRSADLADAALGLLSNPVINEFGKYPVDEFWAVLGPLADYEWSPRRWSWDDSSRRWDALAATFGGCGAHLR